MKTLVIFFLTQLLLICFSAEGQTSFRLLDEFNDEVNIIEYGTRLEINCTVGDAVGRPGDVVVLHDGDELASNGTRDEGSTVVSFSVVIDDPSKRGLYQCKSTSGRTQSSNASFMVAYILCASSSSDCRKCPSCVHICWFDNDDPSSNATCSRNHMGEGKPLDWCHDVEKLRHRFKNACRLGANELFASSVGDNLCYFSNSHWRYTVESDDGRCSYDRESPLVRFVSRSSRSAAIAQVAETFLVDNHSGYAELQISCGIAGSRSPVCTVQSLLPTRRLALNVSTACSSDWSTTIPVHAVLERHFHDDVRLKLTCVFFEDRRQYRSYAYLIKPPTALRILPDPLPVSVVDGKRCTTATELRCTLAAIENGLFYKRVKWRGTESDIMQPGARRQTKTCEADLAVMFVCGLYKRSLELSSYNLSTIVDVPPRCGRAGKAAISRSSVGVADRTAATSSAENQPKDEDYFPVVIVVAAVVLLLLFVLIYIVCHRRRRSSTLHLDEEREGARC